MPIRRIRVVPISILSPSITFNGDNADEDISFSSAIQSERAASRIRSSMMNILLYGVYIFDNFLPIRRLSIYCFL